MLIGVLSDTHDRTDAMAAGMNLLREANAEHFIHCGDVGSVRVLDHLAGLPSAFVWGNTDWDRAGLARYGETIGVRCYGAFGELCLGGKAIALLHGDDAKLKQRILAEQNHDYLLQGHSHFREDRKVGRVRIVNPGALHRANPKTVAMIDTERDSVTYFDIERGAVIAMPEERE